MYFCFRMRRVDACASFLWTLVTGIYLAEIHLLSESPIWLDTAKLGITSLCCLVGFASAVATRKATSQRRQRPRRSDQEQWTLGPENHTSHCQLFIVHLSTPSLLSPVHHCPPVISVRFSIRIGQNFQCHFIGFMLGWFPALPRLFLLVVWIALIRRPLSGNVIHLFKGVVHVFRLLFFFFSFSWDFFLWFVSNAFLSKLFFFFVFSSED